MVSKLVILALIPIVVAWVVAKALRNSLLTKLMTEQHRRLSDAGCFDPTEALHGIL
ncbi:MAG TPA: hypothetical protein VF412_01125 [Bdellovibrio sp.]|uniref:hypothetical protein n=1 Tax=Bdellovibrio sp. TaxID=28201 RepID=UPI002F0BDC38